MGSKRDSTTGFDLAVTASRGVGIRADPVIPFSGGSVELNSPFVQASFEGTENPPLATTVEKSIVQVLIEQSLHLRISGVVTVPWFAPAGAMDDGRGARLPATGERVPLLVEPVDPIVRNDSL